MPDALQAGANRRHTAGIVAAYAGHHQLLSDQVGPLIVTVSAVLARLGEAGPEAPREPAVPVKRSVHRDYVVCLDCGYRAKTVRRHLSNAHGLTPAQYRVRWNLPPGHPLVALDYSEKRSKMAKQFGLGRSRKRSAKVETAKAVETPRRPRGRPRSAKKAT
jgi:predicted transcriptional regulator